MGEIIEFIKRHWIAYLIGAVLAIALGLGTSLLILRVGSTPAELHDKEVAAEQGTGSSKLLLGDTYRL